MEIRDPIHGAIEITPDETAIIDSPAFQRLRRIKQLGFGEFSYPGATHNRYIHSLGVFHLAGQAFDHIFRGYNFARMESRWKYRQVLKLGALLHDIGHGPLSHTTEEVMPPLKDLRVSAYKGSPHRSLKFCSANLPISSLFTSPALLTRIFPARMIFLSTGVSICVQY